MNEIKCPKCGQVFTVDEAGFSEILSQVRTKEFDKEVTKRLAELEDHLNTTHAQEIKLRVGEAVAGKAEEVGELKMAVEKLRAEKENLEQKYRFEMEKAVSEKDVQIERLNSELKGQKAEKELAVITAVAEVEKERDTQKASYEAELAKQRELVEYYKDFKTRMSTKMVGESLERHCENEFKRIKGYLPAGRVTFGKDNEVKSGSKGDFIYRETDEYGNELISIMFEMKNEMDTTSTKHRNEDFFKELDKDRKLKNCEYAVLVSMLEADSDYYNQGIVDVSGEQYEKMYVVRPQCFLTIISILRNAASNVTEYKRRIAELENQSVDITNFENKLESFKDSFSQNLIHARDRFEDAMNEIDATITHLQAVKEDLRKTLKHFGTANNKLTDLSVKKLTKDNPTMIAMFAEQAGEEE